MCRVFRQQMTERDCFVVIPLVRSFHGDNAGNGDELIGLQVIQLTPAVVCVKRMVACGFDGTSQRGGKAENRLDAIFHYLGHRLIL